MNNNAIIERILKAIAQDDMLVEQFAKAAGMPEAEFSEWIDKAQINVPENLFVVYRDATDEDGHSVDSFFAICASEDKAQAKIDQLTEDFGPMGFAYRPVVLE